MSRMLAEQPLLTSLVLGIVGVGLLFGWLQSGKKPLAVIGLVVLAAIPGAWVLAENWVTDRERLTQIIYETADAVEANDHERALALISNPAAKQQAANELPRWEFTQANVGSIRSMKFIEGSYPQQVDVDMTVKVEVSQKGGSIRNLRVPRKLLLTFEKQGENDDPATTQWAVVGYQHMPLVGGQDAYSTQTPR